MSLHSLGQMLNKQFSLPNLVIHWEKCRHRPGFVTKPWGGERTAAGGRGLLTLKLNWREVGDRYCDLGTEMRKRIPGTAQGPRTKLSDLL